MGVTSNRSLFRGRFDSKPDSRWERASSRRKEGRRAEGESFYFYSLLKLPPSFFEGHLRSHGPFFKSAQGFLFRVGALCGPLSSWPSQGPPFCECFIISFCPPACLCDEQVCVFCFLILFCSTSPLSSLSRALFLGRRGSLSCLF